MQLVIATNNHGQQRADICKEMAHRLTVSEAYCIHVFLVSRNAQNRPPGVEVVNMDGSRCSSCDNLPPIGREP